MKYISYNQLCSLGLSCILGLSYILLFKPCIAYSQSPAHQSSTHLDTSPKTKEQESDLKSIPVSSIQFKESIKLKSDLQTWESPGFRVSLTYLESMLSGLDSAPSFEALGVEVGAGARLDKEWSLLAHFQYLGAFDGDQATGLRFMGLLVPSYHWKGMSIGFGVGVAGFIEQRNTRRDAYPGDVNTLVASYTYTSQDEPVPQCTGFGPAGTFQIAYWYEWSEITALGLGIRGEYQKVACESTTDRVEPDTAKAIVRRQWWSHQGWSLFGGFSWR
jgi:hypothetical protein